MEEAVQVFWRPPLTSSSQFSLKDLQAPCGLACGLVAVWKATTGFRARFSTSKKLGVGMADMVLLVAFQTFLCCMIFPWFHGGSEGDDASPAIIKVAGWIPGRLLEAAGAPPNAAAVRCEGDGAGAYPANGREGPRDGCSEPLVFHGRGEVRWEALMAQTAVDGLEVIP